MFLRLGAVLLAAILCGPGAAAGAPSWSVEAPHGPTVDFSITLDEATWSSVDASPDDRILVMDLLGDLYATPMAGGEAVRITHGPAYDAQPRISPDGRRLVFVSDRDGSNQLWVADIDGHAPRQLTHERDVSFSSPDWSADGKEILALRHDDDLEDDAADLVAVSLDGRVSKLLDHARNPLGPTASADGRYIYFSTAREGHSRIERMDRRTGDIEPVADGLGGAVRPAVSPDGKWLAFGRRAGSEDRLVLRDLATGEEHAPDVRLNHDQQDNPNSDGDALPGYAFTSDGASVVYTSHGGIWRYAIGASAPSRIPFSARFEQPIQQTLRIGRRIPDGPVQLRLLRWAQATPNGRAVVFSAAGKLYRYDRGTQRTRRLGTGDGLEYAPAVSPDGKWLAYVGWSDRGLGHIYRTPVDRFAPVRLTTEPGLYEHLAWSSDSRRIVFLQSSGGERRGEGNLEEGQRLRIRWMEAAGGELRTVLALAPRGDRRQEMRPLFDTAGERIFFTTTPARRGETYFESVRLDGTDRRKHLRFRFADDVVPSPNGKWVAFTAQFEAYLAPLDLSRVEAAEIGPGQPSVSQLSAEGAYFLNWSPDGRTVSWSWGPRFYERAAEAPADAGARETTILVSEPRAQARGELLLRDARVITMGSAGVIPRADILVRDNRIAAVGPTGTVRAARSARIIDMSGATIIPGLIDAHAHYRQGRNVEIFPQNDWGFVTQLAYGITTIRDPSARAQSIFTQAEMIETGRSLGPRTFSTGEPIYFLSTPFARPPRDLDDARLQVRRLKALGATAVKMYVLPRREQRQWVVQAARENGQPILVEGAQKIFYDFTVLMDGYTTLEHSIKAAPVSRDVRALIAATEAYNTPTLIVGPGGSAEDYFYEHSELERNERLLRFTPADEILPRARLRPMRPEDDYYFLALARDTRAIAEDGGRIALGGHGNLQGLGAHWELWAMAMGGLPAERVLRAATLDAARALGLERDIGSIEPGKLADLVVLGKDPLADIRNTDSIRFVMKSGMLWDDRMNEVWPEPRPFPGFHWRLDGAQEPGSPAAQEAGNRRTIP